MSDTTARSIAVLGLPRFRTKRVRMQDGRELFFVTTPSEEIVGVVVLLNFKSATEQHIFMN